MSVLISKRSAIMTRDWRIVIKAWSTTARSWGVRSTRTGAAPDAPHHETASKTPNPRIDDTSDNTHATGASGTKQPTPCAKFILTERDPVRISEDECRVNKIPGETLRCHPLHGSASPGISGTGINTGAGITKDSSHGIFGETSSRSPSHIGAAAFGITGSTSSWITGAPALPTASHGTIGVADIWGHPNIS